MPFDAGIPDVWLGFQPRVSSPSGSPPALVHDFIHAITGSMIGLKPAEDVPIPHFLVGKLLVRQCVTRPVLMGTVKLIHWGNIGKLEDPITKTWRDAWANRRLTVGPRARDT